MPERGDHSSRHSAASRRKHGIDLWDRSREPSPRRAMEQQAWLPEALSRIWRKYLKAREKACAEDRRGAMASTPTAKLKERVYELVQTARHRERLGQLAEIVDGMWGKRSTRANVEEGPFLYGIMALAHEGALPATTRREIAAQLAWADERNIPKEQLIRSIFYARADLKEQTKQRGRASLRSRPRPDDEVDLGCDLEI